jgi:hypothetical protein
MPMQSDLNVEPPQIPVRLLRRAWKSVWTEYAYQLFRVYREGWPTTAHANATYGVPQEAPTPSGSGSLQVRVERAVLWFGLEYTASEDRAVTSSRHAESLRGLESEDQRLIRAWLALGNFPGMMSRATEGAFERLATASGLGLSIRQGATDRRVGIVELVEALPAAPAPLNARVRRRA